MPSIRTAARVFSPLFLAVVGLVGCGPADVTGEWQGDWHTTLNTESGAMSLDLAQDGETVTGTFELGGTSCVGSGSVSGTVSSRQVDLTLNNGFGGEVVLDGSVSANDERFEGSFRVTGGFCEDATGKFNLDRQ